MAGQTFGAYIRRKRLTLREEKLDYSLRRVALAVELEPSFLSKVERELVPPPSEAKIKALARVLNEDPDILLALAGKISTDLHDTIRKRPRQFAELIRLLKNTPDAAMSGVVRETRAKYGRE